MFYQIFKKKLEKSLKSPPSKFSGYAPGLQSLQMWLQLCHGFPDLDVDHLKPRPTRNYIHRSNRKRFSNYLLTKVRTRTHPPYMCTSEISKGHFGGCVF